MKRRPDPQRSVAALIVLILSPMALVVGCRESATPPRETGSTATPAQGERSSPSSEATISSDEMPSSASPIESFYPEGRSIEPDEFQALLGDFPVYPGARLMTRQRTPTETTMTFASPDLLTNVLTFYQNRLREIGWPMEITDDPGRGVLLRGTKGKGTYRLFLTEGESRTFIQVTLAGETVSTPTMPGNNEKGKRDLPR